MTEAYDWHSTPQQITIRCPGCGLAAEFKFATLARIQRLAEIEFFQKSDDFEYRLFENSCGSRWHGALFYPGLSAIPLGAMPDLPGGCRPQDWHRSHGLDIGSVTCHACGCRRKHSLTWPDEAHFQIDYKGKVLWAFDRESATVLLDYIRSGIRHRDSRWKAFLLHVPSHFLKRKAREEVTRKLAKLLGVEVSS